jgi:hypothetical protein
VGEWEGHWDRAPGAAHPPSGLMWWGWVLLGPHGRCMTGVGVAGGTLKGGRGQGLPFSQSDRFQKHSSMAGSLRGPCPHAPSSLSSTPAPSPAPGLGVCELQVRARLQTCGGGGVIALAPSFSTVYNLLLCLHIFSVHIIHQSKKRNYENLDQLSYDNKRGPKVYMHGRARHPPTSEPRPAAPRPRGAVWPRCAEPQAQSSKESQVVRQAAGRQERAGAGGVGAQGPPASTLACVLQASTAAGGAALWEVHANFRDPQGFLAEPWEEALPTWSPQGLGHSCRGLRNQA